MATQTHNAKTNSIVIAILVLLLIGTNLAWFFQSSKASRNAEDKYQTVEAELITTYAKLDSISRELNSKIAQIQQLGGKIDTLLTIQKQLEAEKRALLSGKKISETRYNDLKVKIEGYEAILVQKDNEIAQLRKDNKFLTEEVIALKTDKVAKEDSLRALKQQRGELNVMLQAAARLKAVNFRIAAISEKDKRREGAETKNEFKRRHVEKIEIQFNIDENPVAKPGTRVIYMVISDPEGAVLVDDSIVGAASFKLGDKNLFYTLSKEIIFDNTQQLVSFSFSRKGEFRTGTYNVAFYCEGALMGQTQFVIR